MRTLEDYAEGWITGRQLAASSKDSLVARSQYRFERDRYLSSNLDRILELFR